MRFVTHCTCRNFLHHYSYTENCFSFEWHTTKRMTQTQAHWLTYWTRIFTEQYTCSDCSRHSLIWLIIVTTVIESLVYLINIICHFLLLFQFAMSCSSYILVQCIAANVRVMLCCVIGWIVRSFEDPAVLTNIMSGTIYPTLYTMPEVLVLSTITLKTSGHSPDFSHDA
jgi:hypothetical protein